MIIVAHPDDEILGAGATINKLIKDYKTLAHVVILGEGITSRSQQRDKQKWEKELKIHRSNILKAQETTGYQSSSIYDFPDNRFDTIALLDIIKIIETEKNKFNPEVIFTHHAGDLNIDHRITFQAVMTACRPQPDDTVKSIFSFEIPSSTEWQAFNNQPPFIPNFFMEINEDNLNAKQKAMECYEYEKRYFPHPRSIEALKIQAQKRGIEIGKNLAEAYMLIRSIN